jgi:OmpA-OmpF porin, OOP family
MGQRSNIFLILISLSLSIASADDAVNPSSENSNSGAYLTDSAGNAVRGGTGECWRAGIWTAALANVVGCDGVMAKALPVTSPAEAPEQLATSPAEDSVASEQVIDSTSTQEPLEKISFETETLFDFDKTALKNEGKQRLDLLASRLMDGVVRVVVALGHTDSLGAQAYNQQLSEKRAKAVIDYLGNKGIPKEKFYSEGRGGSQPIASNSNEAGRAMNRRVEIQVVTSRSRE